LHSLSFLNGIKRIGLKGINKGIALLAVSIVYNLFIKDSKYDLKSSAEFIVLNLL
jgi:hypothetical protein